MSHAPFTQEEFTAALGRLGERDVRRLVEGGAFDGDEARWAAAWLRGDREPPKDITPIPLALAS